MGHTRHQWIYTTPSCSHLVDGAGGRDRQSVFIHNRHVGRPKVVRRGADVVVVVVFMGAVDRYFSPDAIDEGGVDQMSCALQEERRSEDGKV